MIATNKIPYSQLQQVFPNLREVLCKGHILLKDLIGMLTYISEKAKSLTDTPSLKFLDHFKRAELVY